MFYSQLLLSKKGALGVIWIAAHCHKRLKKEQVQQTNITSSVDKILLDEAPVVTYRILGHLLLGVVRIQSKKVEYLLHDCQYIIEKLSDFMPRKKSTSKLSALKIEGMRATKHVIARPKRFELDTFELEVVEDHCGSSGHVVAPEEIMLSDTRNDEQTCFGLSSKYKEDVSYSESLTMDHTPVRDVCSPHLMDKGPDISPASGRLAALWHLNETRFSLEERFEPMTFGDIDIQMTSDKSIDHQSDDEQMRDINAGNSVNKEHVNEKRSSVEEQREPMIITDIVTEMSLDQPSEKIIQPNDLLHVNDVVNEKRSSLEEQPERMIISDVVTETSLDQPSEKIIQPNELLHVNDEGSADHKKNAEASSSRSRKDGTKKVHSMTLRVDVKPKTRSSGSTSPDFIAVRTPASKERIRRISRKRKCLFDESIVIPNQAYKCWLNDADDLVCNRKKARRTIYHSWKVHRISPCPQSFEKPLIPGANGLSIDSISPIRKNKSTADSAETVEVPPSEDITGSSNKSQEQIPIAPATSVNGDIAEDVPIAPMESLNVAIPESPSIVSIAPSTPIAPTESLNVAIPESPNIVSIAPATPVTGASLLRYHDMQGSSRSHIGPQSSTESTEKGAHLLEHQDLEMDLMDEEINSFEGDTKRKSKFSLRTRKVARFLLENFHSREGKEKVEVNLSSLLKRKTKSESARVFYEILVLKTGGWIDLRQGKAYSNIILQENPTLKQTFEVDDILPTQP